jgi:flagellar hook-associated protein 3 FlgL
MQTNSFPDLLGYSRRNRTTAQIRQQMQTTSQEAVSGLKSDLTKATNGDVGRAHLLQKAQSDITQSQDINSLSAARLNAMSRSVSSAREAMNGIDTRATIALSSGFALNIDPIIKEAEVNINVIMGALNTSLGERNLFSGNQTDTITFASPDVLMEDIRNLVGTAPDADAALQAVNDYFDTPGGGFETRIYQGGERNPPALPLGDGQSIQTGITGKHQAVKDALKGLALMAVSKDSLPPTDVAGAETLFAAGAKLSGTGNSGLIALEAEIGVFSESIQKVSDKNDSEKAALDVAFQNLFGRDQFEAAAELQQLQTQLEASYTITARLSNLTLTNFLR